MALSFNITQQPDKYQFTKNVKDIVIRKATDTIQSIVMQLTLDNKVLYQYTTLYFDANGIITIRLRDILKNVITYEVPADTQQHKLSHLIAIFKENIAIERATVESFLVEGGISASHDMNTTWWSQNFLTWQPQVMKIPIWQPQWLSLSHTTSPRRRHIHADLYTVEGPVITKEIYSTTENVLARIDVSFDSLWRKILEQRELTPIGYDVYGFEEGVTPGANRPFAQRYMLRPNSHGDICFLFQNSLGGFDTIIATGVATYIPVGEINTFTNKELERELENNYKSIWQQNTGYIDSSRHAHQWREFLSSHNRYVYTGDVWKKIIVDEFEVKHKDAALNFYTFKYHLAERDESTYYDRAELQPVELPTNFHNSINSFDI